MASLIKSVYTVQLTITHFSDTFHVVETFTAHIKLYVVYLETRIHNSIVIKLAGDLVSRLHGRTFLFNMANHDNDTVRSITRSPRSIISKFF